MLGIAEQQFGDLDAQVAKGDQRIALTQGGRTPQRMAQAAIEMADLALDVSQSPVGQLQALHAAFSATTHVGGFHPVTRGVPPTIETLFALRHDAHQLPLLF